LKLLDISTCDWEVLKYWHVWVWWISFGNFYFSCQWIMLLKLWLGVFMELTGGRSFVFCCLEKYLTIRFLSLWLIWIKVCLCVYSPLFWWNCWTRCFRKLCKCNENLIIFFVTSWWYYCLLLNIALHALKLLLVKGDVEVILI